MAFRIVRAYHRLLKSGRIPQHASFERIATKKSVRSNSGVVVITILTAPGKFSCPNDCASGYEKALESC